MDEYNKYAALADTIKLEEITSNKINQSILQYIKNYNDDNDKRLCSFYIRHLLRYKQDNDVYIVNDGEELAWLGYYIGQCTNVRRIYFNFGDIPTSCSAGIEVFRRGLGHNKSIQELRFKGLSGSDGQVFTVLDLFLKNNHLLEEFEVDHCELTSENLRQLSLAIEGCNKSLKNFSLVRSGNRYGSDIEDGQLVGIITALSMHPQLERLYLSHMNIGSNDFTALATLLRCTATHLHMLNISGNDVDDEGVDVLVNVLASNNTLQELRLESSEEITIQGWKTLSTILEDKPRSLEVLRIGYNSSIGDDGARMFANALANNSTLDTLDLDDCGITREGWAPFSKLLCDKSSVNNTYLSNHTLQNVGDEHNEDDLSNIPYLLLLNGREDKRLVAMIKILQNLSHFNVQPFFEWEFKVFPLMIKWLAKAANCTSLFEEGMNQILRLSQIRRLRLSATFDFIKEFPMLYVEPMTRKEIAEYAAMEEGLTKFGNYRTDYQAQLEEVRQLKARAMRRL